MNEQTSNRAEIYLFLAMIAVVFVIAFGEYILLGLLVAGLVVAAWVSVWLILWVWRFIGNTRHDWSDRDQSRVLAAIQVRHQLLLEDKQAQLAYPVDGFLPVAHEAIVRGEYNAPLLELAARRIETLAPVPNVPHSLTYSPHISQKGEITENAEVPPAFVVPNTDFYALFMSGKLPKDKFLMGPSLDDGSDVTATWQTLYSALIGGMSGSGKSTLIRSLLAQSAIQGGRFVVIDPHYGAGEESLGASLQPLRNLMLCNVASNDREMLSALKFVADLGQKRLSGQDKDHTPVVLVIDETTGLLQRGNIADQLINVLGMISQETRKVGLYAFCIGQNFSGKVLPTEVRNSFVSFISCRARKDVARVQSGSSEFGELAADLTIGQCVWMTPSGEVHRVSVPNCTQGHLQHVAQMLTVKPNELPMTPPMNIPMTTSQTHGQTDQQIMGEFIDERIEPMTAEERHIRQLFMDGSSVGDIAVEIYGVSRTAGQPYIKACNTVQSAIRKAIK